MRLSRGYSKTPKPKISNSSIHQERRYSNFKKNYELRQKECEYSRDALETTYERAIEYSTFGIDSFYLALGPTKAPSSANRRSSSAYKSYSSNQTPKYKNINDSPRSNLYSNYSRVSPKTSLYSQYPFDSPKGSIFSQRTYESPRGNLYSRQPNESPRGPLYSRYPNVSSSRQYFKLQLHNSRDIALQSGSPIFGVESPFSRNSKDSTPIDNQNVEIQEEEEDVNDNQEQSNDNQELVNINQEQSNENQVEKQQSSKSKKSAKSTKVSNINETSSGEASSIKPLSSPTSKNQQSKIEADEFNSSNSHSKKNSYSKSNKESASNSPKINSNSRSNLSGSGSPTGSGIGAHLYSFSYANKKMSNDTNRKNDINISIDFESDKNNKSDSSNEMMPELHASELESSPHGSFNEEEEEEVEINSNDIFNNEGNYEEEEEIVQIKVNSEDAENEDLGPNENESRSQRSINVEEGIEFNKQLNAVAQNLQSISSNIRTGSSSNPHSEMMNNSNETNEEIEMVTPNRADSSKNSKNKSLSQQDNEISFAHSASSDFSPIVYGKNQSENNSEDSELLSTDGIPKPNIDSPKVKMPKGKKS